MRSWLVFSLLILGAIGTPFLTTAQPPVLTSEEFSAEPDLSPTPPEAGGNGVTLLPGQNNLLNCGSAGQGGGTLCGTQFVIETSSESLGWTLNVRSDNEFVVFMRFNAEVELDDGRPVSDFVLQSEAGSLSFALSLHQPGNQFPGLQSGRYFFAIAHFETSEQQYVVNGSTTESKMLALQTSTQFDCSAIEVVCLQQFTVDVDELSEINLDIRASGEFIAFMRLNQPIQLPPLTFDENGQAQIGIPISDMSVVSQSGQATLFLDQNTTPSIRLGTYYFAFANLENFNVSYTLNASLNQTQNRQPPRAAFSFSPTQPRVDQAIRFTDISSDSGGRIASWLWDFGDNQSSREQHPTHSYTAPGTYRIRLEVSNDAGLSSTITQTITVFEGQPPPSGGLIVLAFDQLNFENPEAWNQRIEQGCVVYTNISSEDAIVHLTTPDDRIETLSLSPGDTLLVCGNAAHVKL